MQYIFHTSTRRSYYCCYFYFKKKLQYCCYVLVKKWGSDCLQHKAQQRSRIGVGSKIDKSGREGKGPAKQGEVQSNRVEGMEGDRRRPDESSDDDDDESGMPTWSWDGVKCGLLDCSKHGDGSIYKGTHFWHRFYHVADTRESTPPTLFLRVYILPSSWFSITFSLGGVDITKFNYFISAVGALPLVGSSGSFLF